MKLDDQDLSRALENSQIIMDTLKSLIPDDMPYKKRLDLMTKIYPKHRIMASDILTIVSGLIIKNYSQGFDRFVYHEKDQTFVIETKRKVKPKVFQFLSNKKEVEISIERLICSVLCEMENLVYEYPEFFQFKHNFFLSPVKNLKPRRSRF